MEECKPYGYIYLTTNLINGKIYVGQHKDNNYNSSYKGSGHRLLKAFKKYGKKIFKCEILEWCETFEELQEREIYWIKKLNSTNEEIGYNIVNGGQGINDYVFTQEVKEKISASVTAENTGKKFITNGKKNRFRKVEECEKLISTGEWHYGKISSELFKETHKNDSKGRIWINNGIINHFVKENELEFYFSQGYHKGKIARQYRLTEKGREVLKNNGKSCSNKVLVNQDGKWIRIDAEDLQKYLDDGWLRGTGDHRKFSEERKEKMKGRDSSTKGRIHINKDCINKTVKKEELELYLNNGWKLGHYKSVKNSDKIAVVKNGIKKLVLKSEINNYLSDGWSYTEFYKKKVRLNEKK